LDINGGSGIMADILKVIQYINPNAKFQITDNDVNQIEWLDDTTPISAEDINAKISEYETAEATKKMMLKKQEKHQPNQS
jgi:hypothetical protein